VSSGPARHRWRLVRVRRLLAAAAVGAALVGLAQPAASARADDVPCDQISTDNTRVRTDRASAPLQLLGVARAQALFADRGRAPGAGANVAVLDSGVYDEDGLIDVAERHSVTGNTELDDYHGTAVAGLIAGRARPDGRAVGIAPGSRIVDVRVYDVAEADPSDPSQHEVTGDAVAAGLEWVVGNARRLRIEVANVSLEVDPSARLRAAVASAWRAGIVVVASSGNRPPEGEPFHDVKRGEDAAGEVYPAAYPHVLAVNATPDGTGEDVTQYVLQSSDTDVAAPTFGAVSVAVNGSTCVLDQIATSWSAAEVSGVVALLRSAYDERPAQIVARLLNTANGTTDTPTKLTGVGVVQPVEALTRPLDPSRSGRVERTVVERDDDVRATPPEPESDLLADARDDAVWWGLIGGGVLVIALLLRPVLARRRD